MSNISERLYQENAAKHDTEEIQLSRIAMQQDYADRMNARAGKPNTATYLIGCVAAALFSGAVFLSQYDGSSNLEQQASSTNQGTQYSIEKKLDL